MEKENMEVSNRVHVAKSVYEGLEFIRRSGVTNMLDRSMVINLAREWDLNEMLIGLKASTLAPMDA